MFVHRCIFIPCFAFTPVSSGVITGTSLCEDADFKRLQVLHVAKEVQQLEEEVQEKLVSRVTAAATERHLQEQKVGGLESPGFLTLKTCLIIALNA